ncbi:hypothetical protein ONE63_010780 [Megalurothrips usitatus]|uniref:SPOC domain-containing protein n=1 Tax=Megalurothrips usitatus TaxID=439358 RepID=A0AAV7XE14_9NEOP|nr:hypothetical protein ONE63_010780 [Megalurothrips usitatus]
MIGISKEDRHRITVKIRNDMKRSSDRDTPPPRSKRSRSSIGRYDDSSDERMTPDRERDRDRGSRAGSRGRSASPRGRYPSEGAHRERDDYRRDGPERTYSSYKVLCVSALHPKASDEVVKETLYREYKKFGDISIRISRDLDERVAYVCFRSSEDARDAKHAKPRIIIYDKVAVVEAVYETSRGSGDVYRRPTSRPRSRSVSPEYDRYYQRSPPPDRHRPGDQRFDRYGPPPGMPHREFRRDGPPPPHDFMRPPVHHGPPPHMPPGPPHHYGPPRHMMHGFKPQGGPGGPHFDKMDPKKDKFPNYLQHLAPEDDPLATRTLFAEDDNAGGEFRGRPLGREDFPYEAPYDNWPDGEFAGNYSGPPRGFRGRGGMPWHDRRGGGRGGFRGQAAFPPDGYGRNEDPEWNSRRPPADADYDRSSASITNDDASVQTRPLRNLVSYLKQKEAAGVISLLNKDTEATGVLYAFPPCPFSTELLKRTAPNLTEDSLKEDHLVIVVVRGGSA